VFPIAEFETEKLKDVTTTRTDIRRGLTRIPDFISEKYRTKSQTEKELTEEWETEAKSRTTTIYSRTKGEDLSIDSFTLLQVLGRGVRSKVMLVEQKDSKKLFAMKILCKERMINDSQVEYTKTEKMILQNLHHPFLVGLECAFQSVEKVFFVLPYLQGGELFEHLTNSRRFSEERARFYAAEICLAVEHLHHNNIIYRDLKLENILLDAEGHIKLTDFGTSKKLNDADYTTTLCGTPEYLSPEIVTGNSYSFHADWWSFGILLYEMLVGFPPFHHANRQVLFNLIRLGEIKFPSKYPISIEAQDLIVSLLRKDPEERLEVEQIKKHPFFASTNWRKIELLKERPPFVPDLEHELDTKYFASHISADYPVLSVVSRSNLDTIMENQQEFEGFTYIPQTNLA